MASMLNTVFFKPQCVQTPFYLKHVLYKCVQSRQCYTLVASNSVFKRSVISSICTRLCAILSYRSVVFKIVACAIRQFV